MEKTSEDIRIELGKDPLRTREGVRLILLTTDECAPCEDVKEALGDKIGQGNIEVRSATDPDDDWATDLATAVVCAGGSIPSLVVVGDNDEIIFTLDQEDLGVIKEGKEE